jgi:hypothetical protein
MVLSAVGVSGVRGVVGDTGAEEARLPGGEGTLSRLSLLDVRTALAAVVLSEAVEVLDRRFARDGLDCGLRSPLGGCETDTVRGRRGTAEKWEPGTRGLDDCDEVLGLDETNWARGLAEPGGRGKASTLTALRRLGVGTRDGDGEDAWVRSVGIDGDEVMERGMAVAARARMLSETTAAYAASRSLSDAACPAGPAPRILVMAGNGGSGIDGGGCACGLRNCWFW